MPAKTIRFYESIGLIAPAQRRNNGYRDYSEEDVALLRFIHRARSLGFSVKEVASLLSLWQDASLHGVERRARAETHIARIDAKAAELACLRTVLGELAEQSPDSRPGAALTGALCPPRETAGAGMIQPAATSAH